jgi:hypothetical protein
MPSSCFRTGCGEGGLEVLPLFMLFVEYCILLSLSQQTNKKTESEWIFHNNNNNNIAIV